MKKVMGIMLITFIFLSLITQAVFTAKESHHEIELIVFSAEWCKYCPEAIDIVKEIAESSEVIDYRVIEYEKNPEEFKKYNVSSSGLPCTIIIIDNEIKATFYGAYKLKSKIMEVIEGYTEETLTSEEYIINQNQSIDKDFIVEGNVEIKGGAVVSFSNCRVEVSEGFRIGENSKVLFKNCRIGDTRYFSVHNAQLTLDNCIANIDDIDPSKEANILIKNTTIKCPGKGIPAGITFRPENKIIIENSNVDSLSIYMSNMIIENLTQGFISNYKLEGNNSELIISDSTINYIDLWNESGVNEINNVSCRSIMLDYITDEEENTIEISNSKAEGLNTSFLEEHITLIR